MNSSAIILFIVIIAISIYDFYILNKSKVKITSCLSSSIITLFFNLILLTIGLLLGKKKNYSPIAATDLNLFFIENSLKKYVIKNRNYEINDLIENKNKNFIFTTYDGNIFTSKKVVLPWHGITVEKINYLPEFLKQFPGNYNIFQRKMLSIFRFYHKLSKYFKFKKLTRRDNILL